MSTVVLEQSIYQLPRLLLPTGLPSLAAVVTDSFLRANAPTNIRTFFVCGTVEERSMARIVSPETSQFDDPHDDEYFLDTSQCRSVFQEPQQSRGTLRTATHACHITRNNQNFNFGFLVPFELTQDLFVLHSTP